MQSHLRQISTSFARLSTLAGLHLEQILSADAAGLESGENLCRLTQRSERDEPAAWRDWEGELIEIHRCIEEGSIRYLQLPSIWEVHEWEIMRRFSDALENEQPKELLLRQLHGRGAFRRFKEQLDRSGLLDRWFDFKRNALREHAVEWCKENDIPFK